jgi:hypothetical protein
MRTCNRSLLLIASTCTGLVIPVIACAQWTVINLHPQGAIHSEAHGVHGSQQVGGVNYDWPPSFKGTLWSGSASYLELAPYNWFEGSTIVYATDGAQQVGVLWTSFGTHSLPTPVACLWSGSTPTWIELSGSIALAVHDGWQAGYALTGGPLQAPHAYLWYSAAAPAIDLHPAGADHSTARGIHRGRQVGYATFEFQVRHASLWSSSAASWVNLHPAGATQSDASDIHGAQQVGWAEIGGVRRASLWSGAASTWVDLDPGAEGSEAYGVHSGFQVGYARIEGVDRASLWTGSPGNWENLSLALPGTWGDTVARDVWTDGATLNIVGYGFNVQTGRTEALLWTRSLIGPCYPNCDASTTPPILNIADFSCFLQKFAAGDPYANCDGSSIEPVLNVADFSCFLGKFAAGCR